MKCILCKINERNDRHKAFLCYDCAEFIRSVDADKCVGSVVGNYFVWKPTILGLFIWAQYRYLE